MYHLSDPSRPVRKKVYPCEGHFKRLTIFCVSATEFYLVPGQYESASETQKHFILSESLANLSVVLAKLVQNFKKIPYSEWFLCKWKELLETAQRLGYHDVSHEKWTELQRILTNPAVKPESAAVIQGPSAPRLGALATKSKRASELETVPLSCGHQFRVYSGDPLPFLPCIMCLEPTCGYVLSDHEADRVLAKSGAKSRGYHSAVNVNCIFDSRHSGDIRLHVGHHICKNCKDKYVKYIRNQKGNEKKELFKCPANYCGNRFVDRVNGPLTEN